MIDVDKVRLWHVRFVRTLQLKRMPYPCMIVEEVEEHGYHMPQCSPASIPAEVGGQITITLKGRGILKAGEKEYECVPGTAFLYRDNDPLISYYYPADGHEKWRFVWINFMGETSCQIIEEINRAYGYFFQLGQKSELENRLLAYRKMAGATLSQSPMEASQMFFELLGLLCQPAERIFHLPRKERQVMDVRNEIQNAFAESVSTNALAQKLGISREHLSRTFREQTGRTLQAFREEQRLNEVLTLLFKSNLSCKEIAVLCHYGSYSSFFRSFKKHYHMSPELFREKNQREQ